MSQLIQLSKHSYVYRSFTIHICPRKKPHNCQRYQITHDGHYLGVDFALNEACKTIDRILNKNRIINH